MPALVIVLLAVVMFLSAFLVVLVGPLVGELVPIGKQRGAEPTNGMSNKVSGNL